MLESETPQEAKASDPNKERQEDVSPIQIKAASPEELAEKLDQLSKALDKKFTMWSEWRKPLENLWNSIYRVYFSVVDNSKTPTRAKVFIPVVFQVIEATVPKLINIIFGDEQYFDVEPTNKKDQPNADAIKLLLTYQLIQADFFEKMLDFVKQLLLYGTSYFFVYWKVTRKWVTTRTPKRYEFNVLGYHFGEVLEWETKREYKVVERRPELDMLDILDVYPDPDSRNEKEGEGVFIETWINPEDMKDMGKGRFPVYANTDSSLLGPSKDASFGSSRQSRRSTRGIANAMSGKEEQIQLLTFWGKMDLDGDGIREEVQIVWANRKVILKAGPNPFDHQKRPIVRCVLFPVPGEWFGLGLVEPILALISELNTLRRQRLDNINQALNRMWKVLNYADIDLDTLVSSPNGLILVDDMASLELLDVPNVTNQAYVEAATVQKDIEDTTAPKSIQGSPDSGRLGRTAKGAQLIIGQALEKFGTASKLLEELGVKRVLRLFHQLNLQFISNDEMLRDPGLYGHVFLEKITPEMIRVEVNFIMRGISDLVNRESKINQVMAYMSIFGKVLSPQTISALAKKVWSLMGFPVDDIEIQAVQPMPASDGGPVAPGAEAAASGQLSNPPGSPVATPKG